jgi:hypothetical protein
LGFEFPPAFPRSRGGWRRGSRWQRTENSSRLYVVSSMPSGFSKIPESGPARRRREAGLMVFGGLKWAKARFFRALRPHCGMVQLMVAVGQTPPALAGLCNERDPRRPRPLDGPLGSGAPSRELIATGRKSLPTCYLPPRELPEHRIPRANAVSPAFNIYLGEGVFRITSGRLHHIADRPLSLVSIYATSGSSRPGGTLRLGHPRLSISRPPARASTLGRPLVERR